LERGAQAPYFRRPPSFNPCRYWKNSPIPGNTLRLAVANDKCQIFNDQFSIHPFGCSTPRLCLIRPRPPMPLIPKVPPGAHSKPTQKKQKPQPKIKVNQGHSRSFKVIQG
jgi:hypothetical protein